MTTPFSSPEKTSLIRESCLGQVKTLSNITKRPLSYLGLPSPWMGDIAVWHPYLERVLPLKWKKDLFPTSWIKHIHLVYSINSFTMLEI